MPFHVLGEGGFSGCGSLSSVRFEPESILSQIEEWAFDQTALIQIMTLPKLIMLYG
jgi:hypothetical protein